MPRGSRENQKSYTKVYHIILRGINSQDVFLDNQDREKFIKEIKNTKETYKYKLYAYVLMTNHIHMLIEDNENSISKIIQSLAIRYAMYFNKKYERIGHVFYNRFHSKSVESEEYLLNVQKYIHKNPQKDGICKMDMYKWSSYQEYMGHNNIADVDFVLSIFDGEKTKAINLWQQYNNKVIDNEEEFETKGRVTDDEAINEIKQKLNIDNILEIQKYNAEYKRDIIKRIATIKGITKKQIARIIGVDRRTIHRAITEK